jgi:protein-disulfide isomerase
MAEDTRRERRASARAERQARERAEAAKAKQRKRLFQLGGALALAAAIIVVIVIATSGGDDRPQLRQGESIAGAADAAELFRGIPQRGITLGNPDAPLTLVEFADLQCPFCRDYTAQALPTIVETYVRDGRLKLEFRNLDFIGTDSTRGAQMAEAVGLQNRLWEFIDIFYANQGGENEGFVTDDFLRDVAGGIRGVDVERAMDDRGLPEVERQLRAAEELAAANAISSTPSFLIGTSPDDLRPLEVQSFDPSQFTNQIDRALAEARAR